MLPFSFYQSKAHMQEHAKGYEFLARAVKAETNGNHLLARRALEYACKRELAAFGLIPLHTTT